MFDNSDSRDHYSNSWPTATQYEVSSAKFHSHHDDNFSVVPVIVPIFVILALIGCCVWLCRRCCCRRQSGRVLAPAPVNSSTGTAPYPQQQYPINANMYPVTVTMYPNTSPAPFPPPAPYPTSTPYPTPTPYPTGAPAPAAYPVGALAPAPYPTGAPAPYPSTAPAAEMPNVIDHNACPPSYEQVMSGAKQPPYNPNAPH